MEPPLHKAENIYQRIEGAEDLGAQELPATQEL